MLVLTRKEDESIMIGDEIEVKVIEVVPSEGSRPRISLSQRTLGDEA